MAVDLPKRKDHRNLLPLDQRNSMAAAIALVEQDKKIAEALQHMRLMQATVSQLVRDVTELQAQMRVKGMDMLVGLGPSEK